MKAHKAARILKVRIVSKKRSEVSTGFGEELRKLIALKQRMPLHFVG